MYCSLGTNWANVLKLKSMILKNVQETIRFVLVLLDSLDLFVLAGLQEGEKRTENTVKGTVNSCLADNSL